MVPLLVFTVHVLLLMIRVRSDSFLTKFGEIIPSDTLRTVIEYSISPKLAQDVFQLTDNGVLSSPVQDYDIASLAQSIQPCPLNMPIRSRGEKVSQPSSRLECKVGHGYTFVYDSQSNRLLSAFGRGLDLQPLDPVNYPGTFINRYDAEMIKNLGISNRQSTFMDEISNGIPLGLSTNADISPIWFHNAAVRSGNHIQMQESLMSRVSVGQGECAKGRVRYVELAIAYDTSLCESFGYNEEKRKRFFQETIRKASRIFEQNTCIRLRIVHDDPNCNMEERKDADYYWEINNNHTLPLEKPLNLSSCSGGECKRAAIVLRHLRQFWHEIHEIVLPRHDAVLFFSGYDDGTNVAGAAFEKSICDPLLGFGWVEAPPNILGADKLRADRGIAAIVSVIVHEIAHLLGAQHDDTGIMKPVLHRNHMTELSDKSANEIINFVDHDPRSWCVSREIGSDGLLRKAYGWDLRNNEHSGELVDFAFVKSNDRSLGSSQKPALDIYVLNSEVTPLAYRVTKEFYCTADRKCHGSTITNANDGYPVNFKTPLPESDILRWSICMASIQTPSSDDMIIGTISKTGKVARYIIGYEPKSGAYQRSKWSPILYVRDFCPRKVKSHRLVSGPISSSRSNDLLWMYLSYGFGRLVLRYRVALDLDSLGKPKSGWGPEITVPGWYGPSSGGITVAVHDVTGDGQPDLVFAFYEWSVATYSIYYRVGKNLDRKGRVTSGWSDFRRIPTKPSRLFFGEFEDSGMAIIDMDRDHPVMVTSYDLEMRTSDNAFSNLRFHTPKLDYSKTDNSFGCHRCLKDQRTVLKCEEDLKLCAARYDELTIDKDVLSRAGYQISAMNPKVRMAEDSGDIFCFGFKYLYKEQLAGRGNCDITDDKVVWGNGAIEAFLHVLNEIAPGAFTEEDRDINKEQTNGVHGAKREPSIGNVITVSSRKGRKETLRKALDKLNRIYGRGVFDHARIYRKGNRIWVVIPVFNMHRDEV